MKEKTKANLRKKAWCKGYIIKEDHIEEVEQDYWTGAIKIIEYRHDGTVFKTEQEAIAWLALKRATEARNEMLEKEDRKWWQIWK